MAAKDSRVDTIFITPELRNSSTDELFPPSFERPQVITDPFSLIAAKALLVDIISVTLDNI